MPSVCVCSEMKLALFFEDLLLVEAAVPSDGGEVDASKLSEAMGKVRVYIDSGGVVRTLIFTFMVKHTVFAG